MAVRLSMLPFDHPESGLSFTADAREVLGSGGWRGFQEMAAEAMRDFFMRTGREVSFWFHPAEGWDRSGARSLVVTLWFVPSDSGVSEIDFGTIYRAVKRSGLPLTSRGMQPLDPEARPSLVYRDGRIHQVWLYDDPDPVSTFLVWNEADEELDLLGARRFGVRESDFLPGAEHVLLVYPDDSVLCT